MVKVVTQRSTYYSREGFDSKNMGVVVLKNFDLKKKYGQVVDSKNARDELNSSLSLNNERIMVLKMHRLIISCKIGHLQLLVIYITRYSVL